MTRNDDPQSGPPATKRQRIAKLIARAGLCSRRDAEAWVVAGRVSVNGERLTSPAIDVGPDDTILVDGAPLPAVEKTRLFLFHKPRGLVTSDRDPEGRATVAAYLQENWPDGPRVVTVGRLDINTEGLLLLTNDGGLARVLELPQTGWMRRYRVRAKGTPDQAALDALSHGVTIDEIDYAGIEAKLDRIQGANCWLTMGLREGKNREVKRVLEHVGLEVNRLIRLSFGPFQLLDLPEGAVEEVRTRVLRDQLGETLAAQAGVDLGMDEPPARQDASGPERRREGTPMERRPKAPADRSARSAPHAARGAAGSRPAPSSRRDEFPRHGDRREDAPQRERPKPGTRKHVSTLRAAEIETSRKGPRKRIERSDTHDRRDRTVAVERLVPTGARVEGTRSRRDDRRKAERQKDAMVSSRRSKPVQNERLGSERSERGRSGSGAPPRRPHASPSALGKRERMARSGATERGARPREDMEKRERGDSHKRERVDAGKRETRAPRMARTGDAPSREPSRRTASPGDKRSRSKGSPEPGRAQGKRASDRPQGKHRPDRTQNKSRSDRQPGKSDRRPSTDKRPRGPSKPKR